MNYQIRNATRKELEIMIDWAAKEGQNPGIYDTDSFYATDPNGYFLGFVDNFPISSISAVSYGGKLGYLGFYIVKPEFRGKGFGIKIWRQALKYLEGQKIGLDGVVTQQENYKKSGLNLLTETYDLREKDPKKLIRTLKLLSLIIFSLKKS